MRSPRILLADDNSEMRERVGELLRSDFLIVGVARNGQQALESALRLTPDILILDISMSILNGIQVAKQLRESGCSTKVIFLTVHEDHDYAEAAFSLGALGYVLKPRIGSDLIPAIQGALGGHRFISQFRPRHLE